MWLSLLGILLTIVGISVLILSINIRERKILNLAVIAIGLVVLFAGYGMIGL